MIAPTIYLLTFSESKNLSWYIAVADVEMINAVVRDPTVGSISDAPKDPTVQTMTSLTHELLAGDNSSILGAIVANWTFTLLFRLFFAGAFSNSRNKQWILAANANLKVESGSESIQIVGSDWSSTITKHGQRIRTVVK